MIRLPERLLLGPGPSNVHPDVLAAQALPLVGHLDPAFLAVADGVQRDLRALFGTRHRWTLPLSATGSGGMQACFANLLEPGQRAVVGVAGVFGERMSDVAGRLGAQVARVETEPGTALEVEPMVRAIERERPSVVALVHAETSTGVLQPESSIRAIAAAARQADALLILDCVTSLGGVPLHLDAWGVDAAYSGTQKCLSCPPGLSPASFSDRAFDRVRARRRPVPSWYFDLSLLAGYYGGERVYHHTAPISAVLGLAAALERVRAEGMEARAERHRRAAAHLVAGLEARGFTPLVAAEQRLPMLTSARLPDPVVRRGEAEVRRALLARHGIEVGGGLGKLAGQIWRIGLMGENARVEVADRLLAALDDVLARP